MKKWILIPVIIIIVIVWQSISVYQAARADKETPENTTQNRVMDRYPIKHINQITYYHGSKDYHVVNALLKDGRHVFIWVPDKLGKGQFLMLPASSGYSKSEILKAFEKHVPYKKIVSARLGIEDATPVWEITYIDTDGNLVFSYYDFDTGASVIGPISIQ